MLAGERLEFILSASVYSTCTCPCAELTNLGSSRMGISSSHIVVLSNLQGAELNQSILCRGGSSNGNICADGISKSTLCSIDVVVGLSSSESSNSFVQSCNSSLIISNCSGISSNGCFKSRPLITCNVNVSGIIVSCLSSCNQFSIAGSKIAGSNTFIEGLECEALPYSPVVTCGLVNLQTNGNIDSLGKFEIDIISTIASVEPSSSFTTAINGIRRNLCNNSVCLACIYSTCHSRSLQSNNGHTIFTSRQADSLIETSRRCTPVLCYTI